MNTTANADAMTAILRQISLDWNRTISYGRSYIAIFFAYVPGFTCLMAATGPLSLALREPPSAERPPAS